MSYQIIDEKIVGKTVSADGSFMQMKLMHIVCDAAADIPAPEPAWSAGSRCDVLEDSGSVRLLSSAREWMPVNFYNQGGSGGDFDPDSYYTKPQTDARITEKVAEIVADAPEDFDTLKEMSDWISQHEESAAAMNTAIRANATAITGKVDKETGKGLSTNDYSTAEKTKLAGLSNYDDTSLQTTVANKVDKVTGKGLSTEDFTTDEKTKLAGIETSATHVGQTIPAGTEYSIAGDVYTVGANAEIFNDYANNKAIGTNAHAEGGNNTALGNYAHAEGNTTEAYGAYTHAEGNETRAYGLYSHAEGKNTWTNGTSSHAEGNYTMANYANSHSEGLYTVANSECQHVQGKYNRSDQNNKYAFIIGNGTGSNARSNAFAVDWNGLVYVCDSETGINLNTLASGMNNKVDKITGKGLSTEDFTTAEKTKLAGIETGAEVNIQSDWEQSDSTADDFIKNKPTLGSAASRSVVLSLSNAGSGLPTAGTVYNALENKVDKVTGKGLSTEDYTTAEKNKLAVLSELNTATVTVDLNSQTWTESANGLFYTGNISVTNLYRVFSTIITGFSALKPTDNVAVIANSDKTAIRLTASTNTFSNNANITVSVFGRFTS